MKMVDIVLQNQSNRLLFFLTNQITLLHLRITRGFLKASGLNRKQNILIFRRVWFLCVAGNYPGNYEDGSFYEER